MQVPNIESIQALLESNQQLESDHVAQISIKRCEIKSIKVCRAQCH